MFKFLAGLLTGLFVGYFLELLIPFEVFLIACVRLPLLSDLFFRIVPFGLRDLHYMKDTHKV